MIRLEELTLVQALSQQGSIHSAARELGMSQPALSKKIARMEDKLGVTVFHRTTRGTTLTLYGDRLLKKGRILLEGSAQLQREIELMAGLKLAELRIGVGPIIEYLYLPQTMSRLLMKYPSVNFDIRVDNTAKLLIDLKKRKLDIIVGSFLIDNLKDGLVEHPLAEEELIFVVRKNHPAFKRVRDGEQVSLFAYPMALPDLPPKFKEMFTKMMQQSGFQSGKTKCDNYHIIKHLIHNSDHFTGGPRSIFHEELASGAFRIFPGKLKIAPWSSSVLYTEEAQHSPIVVAFQQEIKALSELPAARLV